LAFAFASIDAEMAGGLRAPHDPDGLVEGIAVLSLRRHDPDQVQRVSAVPWLNT
jgi:hypothetical protein